MGEFVTLEVADGIGTIRLKAAGQRAERPADAELADAAARRGSDEVRAVIIYGGEKVSRAGRHQADGRGELPRWPSAGELQATMGLIAGIPSRWWRDHRTPGGGLELALAADPGRGEGAGWPAEIARRDPGRGTRVVVGKEGM